MTGTAGIRAILRLSQAILAPFCLEKGRRCEGGVGVANTTLFRGAKWCAVQQIPKKGALHQARAKEKGGLRKGYEPYKLDKRRGHRRYYVL